MHKGEVEIDVFSGRPNPRWKLSSSEAVELQTRIKALRQTASSPSIPALGFRGFVVRLGACSAVVFSKRVIVTCGRSQSVFVDTEGIQELLSRQAGGHGFGRLLHSQF